MQRNAGNSGMALKATGGASGATVEHHVQCISQMIREHIDRRAGILRLSRPTAHNGASEARMSYETKMVDLNSLRVKYAMAMDVLQDIQNLMANDIVKSEDRLTLPDSSRIEVTVGQASNSSGKSVKPQQEKASFVCNWPQCGKAFTLTIALRNHIAKCHDGERFEEGVSSFECKQCPLSFGSFDEFRIHQRVHVKRSQEAIAETPPQLESKYKSLRGNNGETYYKCTWNMCKLMFRSTAALMKHYNAEHQIENAEESDGSDSILEYVQQQRTRHESGAAPPVTSQDNQVSSSEMPTNSTVNIEERHELFVCYRGSDGLSYYRCTWPKCGLFYRNRETAILHRKKNHEIKNKAGRHGCHQCDATFESKYGLGGHMKAHFQSKIISLIVGLDQGDVEENDETKETQSADTKAIKYRCGYPLCDRVFLHLSSLKQHRQHHISESAKKASGDALAQGKAIKCPVAGCDREFKNTVLFIQHRACHPKVTDVKANIPSTSTKPMVKCEGKVIVTNREEYMKLMAKLRCTSCNKSFPTQQLLSRHAATCCTTPACSICEEATGVAHVQQFDAALCDPCTIAADNFVHNPQQYYCTADGTCPVTGDNRGSCDACFTKLMLQKLTIDESTKYELIRQFCPKLQATNKNMPLFELNDFDTKPTAVPVSGIAQFPVIEAEEDGIQCKVCNEKSPKSRIRRSYGVNACGSCATFFKTFLGSPRILICDKDGRCMKNADSLRCKSCLIKQCFNVYKIDVAVKKQILSKYWPRTATQAVTNGITCS